MQLQATPNYFVTIKKLYLLIFSLTKHLCEQSMIISNNFNTVHCVQLFTVYFSHAEGVLNIFKVHT